MAFWVGFNVTGFELRVQGEGFKVAGPGFRLQALNHMAWGSNTTVCLQPRQFRGGGRRQGPHQWAAETPLSAAEKHASEASSGPAHSFVTPCLPEAIGVLNLSVPFLAQQAVPDPNNRHASATAGLRSDAI